MIPTTERETLQLFNISCYRKRHQWTIVHEQTRCPDVIIESVNGETLRAEFEFKSKNFVAHGHSPQDCDLIICWDHNWTDNLVPVWELSTSGCFVESDFDSLRISVLEYENQKLKTRIGGLQARNLQLETKIDGTKLWLACLVGHSQEFCYVAQPDKFETKLSDLIDIAKKCGSQIMTDALHKRCSQLKCKWEPDLCDRALSGPGAE